MSKIVYLYVKTSLSLLLPINCNDDQNYFVNSQQFLFIIPFICEVITLHKIHMISLFPFISSPFLFFFSQDHSKIANPSTQNYSLLYMTHRLDYIAREQKKTQS